MNSTAYWQQVEELFQATLERTADERAQFLATACGADESLRAEVASLLAAHEGEAALIDRSVPELAARLLATNETASLNGQTIRQYRFLELLGQGGMGEVWLAHDEKLQRQVAIKALTVNPLAATQGQTRLLGEAQATARLDHPNVCTVYEILEADTRCFIVMQYVEGETLAERLKRGRLDWRTSIELAAQIADALAEAHRLGIVHRDIKPQNVMLDQHRPGRGAVKVLDFGIAELRRLGDEKTGGQEEVDISVSPSPRPPVPPSPKAPLRTTPGLIFGTPGYLSPEQARGEVVDGRSDLFSLGVVLYEMLTGRAPFEADSISEAVKRTLTVEPEPLTAQLPDSPAALTHSVAKLLAKQPEQRYQTAEELLRDLQRLRQERVAVGSQRFGWQWAAALFLLLFALAAGAYWRTPRSATPPLDSLAVLPFQNAGTDGDTAALADGLTESLINSFSKLHGLRVVPRTVAFNYKGKSVDPQELGRQLGVKAVLTGRLAWQGGQFTLQIELIDVTEGAQLWGEQYQRPAAELQAVQRQIMQETAGHLRLRLDSAEQLAQRPLTSPEAYEAYLKGLRAVKQSLLSAAIRKEALAQFNRAIELDPNFAPAYAGLALTWSTMVDRDIPSAEAVPKIKATALKALALDDTLDDAHHALAEIYFPKEYDFAAGHREFKRAIELNPNDSQHPDHYAVTLIHLGLFAEAQAMLARAKQLEPYSQAIDDHYALLYYATRQADQLLAQARRMSELYGDTPGTQYRLVQGHLLKGQFAEALHLTQKLAAAGASYYGPPLGVVYALANRLREARQAAADLQAAPAEVGKDYRLAQIYAALGDAEQAMDCLERCYADRESRLLHLKNDMVFDKLRANARFQDLLRRIGLSD